MGSAAVELAALGGVSRYWGFPTAGAFRPAQPMQDLPHRDDDGRQM